MSWSNGLARVVSGLVTLGDGAARPYRPFIDPLEIHRWWWVMLAPMAFGVAVVYKAVRVKDAGMRGYWPAVLWMTAQVVGGMALLAAASYLFVMVYVRWMAGG
jgi:hypothetical protein